MPAASAQARNDCCSGDSLPPAALTSRKQIVGPGAWQIRQRSGTPAINPIATSARRSAGPRLAAFGTWKHTVEGETALIHATIALCASCSGLFTPPSQNRRRTQLEPSNRRRGLLQASNKGLATCAYGLGVFAPAISWFLDRRKHP
jgi:hypothetical protein